MCGWFTVFDIYETIENRFQISLEGLGYVPRYNISPSQDVLVVVRSEEGNRSGMLRWGLIPVWAKDKSIGYKMINARSETVHQKPAYKRLLKHRRCIIPASGFFEWKRRGAAPETALSHTTPVGKTVWIRRALD